SEKQLIVFLEPPDTRGTTYLTFAYRDHQKDDDMWVFLPAESLTRRIAGGARKGSFMRSDYALEDIFRREVDEDTWELLGEANLDGAMCHALKATPLDPKATGYVKRLFWIRQDINLPTKIEYYGPKDKLLKTLLLGDFQNIQGIWIPKKQLMTAQGADSNTTLELTDVVFNEPLAGDLFQSQNLKR
ncbi:MAG: outer membrane lipoprotein-sorting protein, partial [Deltaproteobacteria bacterium]|nr:outer membrane lipoprotein-sorting protein [Deltaproteobacteria bacterium]